MSSNSLELLDVVRVVRVDPAATSGVEGSRAPIVGDLGTVVEVYTKPDRAYEVECVDDAGYTVWLATMLPDQLAFVSRG